MDKEKYSLTPKGIFISALETSGLVEDMFDKRIEAAWTIFQLMMEQHGYVKDGDEEECY